MKIPVIRILLFASIALISLAVAASAQYATISGQVTDAQTGEPIIEAQVGAINMDDMTSRETFTDSAGNYFIDSITPGYQIVGASKEGYEENVYPDLIMIEGGENLTDIDIQLTFVGGTGFGAIAGQVTDAETGLPIDSAGIDIRWFVGSCYTDSDGNYFCDSIPDGSYLVSAYNEGYFPATYPDSVIVQIGETTANIDIALTPHGEPGSISGTVTNAQTGEAAENVYISASGQYDSGYDWTDASGNFLITDLLQGEYTVNAWSESYWEEDYPGMVTVAEGQETSGIDFNLVPHGGPGDGIISGQVLEEGTLEPVPMGLVIAYSDNDNFDGAFTNPDGSYTIMGLPMDEYYVVAIIQDYVVELYDGVYSWEDATTVFPDASGIDFLLAPSDSGLGGVTGILTSNGTPLEGAMVYAEMNSEMRNSAQTSSDGSYSIDGLSPGMYTIKASMVAYHDGSYADQLQIGTDKINGIDIELDPMLACDPNGDGSISVSDAVYLINYIFTNGFAPVPMEAGDSNCDQSVNVSDAVWIINYVFVGGNPPCDTNGDGILDCGNM